MNSTQLAERLWKRLRGLNAAGYPIANSLDVVAYVSVLLYLRLVDQVVSQQAKASLTDSLKWSGWSHLRGAELDGFFDEQILPWFAAQSGLDLGRCSLGAQSSKWGDRGTETLLDVLVDWTSEVELTNHEMAGELLENVIDLWTKAAGRAQITTPRSIVELMSDLADPQPGDRVYDPCFGTAGLLSSCVEQMKAKLEDQARPIAKADVFGTELDAVAFTIGFVRLSLTGITRPRLRHGDTFSQASDQRFDVVVANPPWGVKRSDGVSSDRSKSARPPSSENLFIQHIASSLQEGGRAVVVVPDSLLFRSGPDEELRRRLMTEFQVEGVISLPEGSFAPATGIKSSLILFRRQQPADDVRFLNVRRLVESKNDDRSTSESPSQIAARWREFHPGDDSWTMSIDELQKRGWELVAKRTGEKHLQQQFAVLRQSSPNISIDRLDHFAEVQSGCSYQKAWTATDKSREEAVGIVRVGDIKKGRLHNPSLHLNEDRGPKLYDRHRLFQDDILVSIAGTVGKVAIVEEQPGNVIASQNLAIIRPVEPLSSDYLACLLQSESYYDWLRGHSRGTTIQSLSLGVLRQLMIPVPDSSLQERVVAIWSDSGGDALEILASLVRTNDDDTPLWLNSVLGKLYSLPNGDVTPVPARVDRLVSASQVVRNRQNELAQASPKNEKSQHSRWLQALSNALGPLKGATRVKDNTIKYAALQGAVLYLNKALKDISEKDTPDAKLAHALTTRLIEDCEVAVRSLVADVVVEATLDPAQVTAGRKAEVQLRLELKSALPISEFCVTTDPNLGHAEFPVLQSNRDESIALNVPPQDNIGTFEFIVEWRGMRLIGEEARGEFPLALQIVGSEAVLDEDEFGTSPYITGSPIDREDMFYGRQDIIDAIMRQLSTSHRANVILLEGNRRTGKTSVLMHLLTKAQSILPKWLVVNCSFQGGEGHASKAGLTTQQVYRLLATRIGRAAYDSGTPVWFSGEPDPEQDKPFVPQFVKHSRQVFDNEYPFETFELYLQAVLDAVQPRHLLLMLDEFDKLQDGIDSGITSAQVPENIRYLIHTYPQLSVILTGSRRLRRLREQYWSALFGLGHPIPVKALPLEASQKLVTNPSEGQLVFVREARDRIVELCACQPFLIQGLCNRIFERQARVRERTVSESCVDEVSNNMVRDNEHFRTLWDLAETERRRLVLSICDAMKNEPDPVTLPLLETKLEEFGVPVEGEEGIADDLLFLRELELLELVENDLRSEYRLAVPLMASWIRCNVDIEDQKRRARREAQEAQS